MKETCKKCDAPLWYLKCDAPLWYWEPFKKTIDTIYRFCTNENCHFHTNAQ